jgi:pimeloyl-ACP methyl ester carboxylesterase
LATTLEQKLGAKIKASPKNNRRGKMSVTTKGTVTYTTPSEVAEASKPTVVLIHNMWGNHRILHRHVQFFNELGHNCVTFNLFRASSIQDPHPFGIFKYFQFMHQVWVEQVQDVLDSVEGQKIIFAMSGPSIAGIIAGSQRADVTHLICDSGPFKEIWQCTYRLLTQIWHIPTAPLRALFTTVSVFLWGPTAYQRSQKALNNWDKNVPILSIRGTLDPLVFPKNIDGIFKNHSDLNIKVWLIEGAHHLDGLKMFPVVYKKEIANFLQST